MTQSLFVTKRDGRREPLDLDKIHRVITWAAEGLSNVSVSQVELKSHIQFYDGIKSEDIHETIIKAAADLISKDTPDYQPGDEVQFYVASQTDLGYKVVVDHQHWGLLYKNQVFKPLRIGYKGTAYVQKMRDDFRIDLMLDKPGYEKAQAFTDVILERLKHKGGSLPISDKSTPEQIYGEFGVSKKMFKQAIGALYKAGKIVIEAEAIRLV